jgi:integrase
MIAPKKPAGKPLPRGYRVRVMTDGRPKPALLIVAGFVHEAFEKESEARAAGLALAAKEREFGREVRNFDVAEWRRYQEAKRTKFGGREPDWSALSARMTLETASKTVAKAVEDYREQRKGEGLSPATLSQMKKKLARFADTFGKLKLHEVTTEGVRAWIAGLAKEFQPWTVVDHLKVANTFWEHAKREKWCLDNPLDAVQPPKVPRDEINILTVAETEKLFAANVGQPCIGRLAAEAFGALRFSSAGRLVPATDIKWADKGIELPGAKHKSGRRQYVDGLPDNLWAWLESLPVEKWTATERQYMKEKGEAFIRAGVKFTPNCLRHSFATYHCAAYKDASKTALLMQHTSAATLWKHYKGKATHADGLKYFAILPAPAA